MIGVLTTRTTKVEKEIQLTEVGMEVLKEALESSLLIYEDCRKNEYDGKCKEDIKWFDKTIDVLKQVLSIMN